MIIQARYIINIFKKKILEINIKGTKGTVMRNFI